MKLKRFLYVSFIIYGVLAASLILAGLVWHEETLFSLDSNHQFFFLTVMGAQGVLTTIYWFVVLIIHSKYKAKQQAQVVSDLNRVYLALEAAGEGIWDWSFTDDKIYFSSAYCAILGFTQEEFGNTKNAWLKHLVPDARENANNKSMRFIAEDNGQYDKTYRMLHRDNSHRWIRARGSLIKNEQGKPIRFIGTARDETDQYAAKVQLQQAKAVFESTREAVLVTDHNNNIVYVNPAFTRITGYNELEVIGKNPSILKTNHHSKEFHQRMWETLHEKGVCCGEVWNCHKNGELLRQYQTVQTIKNENDIVSHYVAVFSDISTIDDSISELNFLSLYDPLTKLANRAHLTERLKISLEKAIESDKNHACFLVGLDHFKNINASLGHNQGDQLLQDVALRIKEAARLSKVVARIGGDEFILICETTTTPMDAVVLAESIIEACKAPFKLAGNQVFISVSIGICLYPLAGTSVEDIMRNADSALHTAKKSGRDTFAFYSTDMTEKAFQRVRIASDLRFALQRNELELHYQPVYELNERKLVGCEALVRWNHPTKGRIAPNDFIPIAEESGLISAIDAWVLREACQQMHKWLISNYDLNFMAVNLSSRSLSEEKLVDKIALVLQQSNLDAKFLEIEVTESAVMENPKQADTVLRELRDLGIRLAIDDFGTGFSSLGRLKSLPVHKLKIDQSFIRNLPHDTEDVAIVNAILALGVSMGLEVQAEGIETVEQEHFLQVLQCALGQGYLFGRPMLVVDFAALLEHRAVF